ncbi:BTB/POZ domain-containing protein 2-like isoform X2 [Cimex lectularius]|uniref:BTB domain-containing protein n=1 Tax=Cimex lectularius TaxID=79782 RepID=A0A8I6RDR1_CIMLE|nr:BTB/POZ domain-containing protein 2-like isoform X2 [Cimex lectularius]
MCPSENPSSFQPLQNRLFDREAGSDVTFLVGHGQDMWRFPGHRSVLSEANPVFKAMLNFHASSPEGVIPIGDVEGKAFDLLLRYLYKEDVHIQSVSTALSTLYAAQKYLCPGLMRHCICYLDQSLDVNNALLIFVHIRFYTGQSKKASAPPMEHLDLPPDQDFEDMATLCKSLLHNCLLFIDNNAAQILVQEGLEDLPKDSLWEIVERDTLNAPEHIIYAAIERWSSLECKRLCQELSPDNLRSILGDEILFSVRYLLMTQREFFEGPMRGNLLTKAEVTALFEHLHKMPVTFVPATITEERLKKFREKRRPSRVSRIQLGKKQSEDKKKWKEVKKKKKKNDKESSSKTCTGTCVFDYFFRALACILD